MNNLTKKQKNYLIELLEDKIFMDEDVSCHESNEKDKEFFENHIKEMKEIVEILKK